MMVDLADPELTIHVDVIKGRGLVYSNKVRGPGGLPVGTAGRSIHLFSGGIDSPVAAWLLLKRGSRPVYLHFYLAPSAASAVDSKITKLQKVLSDFGGRSALVLCPFADYQLVTAGVPGDLEPMLFRRYMRMVAEELAPRFDAVGISTGDSLSQAASQTAWNLSSFDEGSSLPILRPLLTYDKEEIVSLAKRIGTYELSLEEYKDCCAMITRHPRTKVRAEVISECVRKFGLRELAKRSIEKALIVVYNPERDGFKQSPLTESPPRVKSR
jgi:tRNA uracil 4-sulfurtransferase